jgi:hypothetical protein
MPLSTETIRNKPLNGRELIEIAVNKFREQLERDCYFLPNLAYRRVSFSIKAIFHLSDILTKHEVVARVPREGAVEGEPPLALNDDEDSLVVGLERNVVIDNPNITRVQNNLPVTVQVKNPQKPDEMFPSFEDRKLHYDKKDFAADNVPVDRDVSKEAAKSLGVAQRKRRNRRLREISSDGPTPDLIYDETDLEEISKED